MKQRIYLIIFCVVLVMMAACTHSSETKDDVSSSFFRVFSDAYGMSPSDYRRAARK